MQLYIKPKKHVKKKPSKKKNLILRIIFVNIYKLTLTFTDFSPRSSCLQISQTNMEINQK